MVFCVLSFEIEGFLGIFRTLTGVGVRSKANMLHIKLSRVIIMFVLVMNWRTSCCNGKVVALKIQ